MANQMALSVAMLLAVASALPFSGATSTGRRYGRYNCLPADVSGFLYPQASNPCNIGPSYWCIPGSNNIQKCMLDWVKDIGVCGYSSGPCRTVADMETFCSTVPNALTYLGGLTNVPPGYSGLHILALYWPPTFCNANGTGTGNGWFCSQYTKAGLIGGRTMQAHGLWPDYGSSYGTPGTPPYPSITNLTGAYQGWPQYCSANQWVPGSQDNSVCHVNGGLCPDGPQPNQAAYDDCMAKYNIPECVVAPETYTALHTPFTKYGAGFLGSNGSFAIHEFTKHGSCIGGYLTHNKTAYFDETLRLTKVLREGHPVVKYIEKNRGKAVPSTRLIALQQYKSISRCSRSCELLELWFCFGINADGTATRDPPHRLGLITCGPGNLASENCASCPSVIIPDFERGPYIKA